MEQLVREAMRSHAAAAAMPCDTPEQARAQAMAEAKLWVLETKRLPRLLELRGRAALLWAYGKAVDGRRRVGLPPIPGILAALTRAGRAPPPPPPPSARWDAPEDEEGEEAGADDMDD